MTSRRRVEAVAVGLAVFAAASCGRVGFDLGDASGGAPRDAGFVPDAGPRALDAGPTPRPDAGPTPVDAGPRVDAATPTGTSCRTLLMATPGLPSGRYDLDPDGSGPRAAYGVYCDMTTAGGGWTLVAAASPSRNDMPRFDISAATPCVSASPGAPCFLGAANLASLPFTEFAWSTTPTASATRAPIDNMLAGEPVDNAICVSATEYYRFNQDLPGQGMSWTGCTPTEVHWGPDYCEDYLRPTWNLISCTGIPLVEMESFRSSPDYNCSPFGAVHPFSATTPCTQFEGMRHWRR